MIDTHKGAFEVEWRARFSLPLSAIGETMTWGEALRITQQLAADPASFVGAALAGWDHPVPHESIVLMNLYDLEHQIAWAQGGGRGARPKPHPRPWPSDTRRQAKPDATLTQDEILAALRFAGHTRPVPMSA